MGYRLQYWPVALLVRLIGAVASSAGAWRRHPDWRAGVPPASSAAAGGAAQSRDRASRTRLRRSAAKSCAAFMFRWDGCWAKRASSRATPRENASAGRGLSGLREFRGGREARQRRPAADGALRRLGGRIVLSLAPGTSHADRGAAAGQSLRRCAGHALSRTAWQHHDRQAGVRARPDRGHATQRNRRHSDGHQHDAAAGRLRGLLRHSSLHGQRIGAHRAAHRSDRGSGLHHLGLRSCASIAWSSTAPSTWCAPATTMPTRWPTPRNFTEVIESYVRRYPDQWLWVHRRWKTRPPGQPPLY